MRRGFKTESNEHAVSLRRELKLKAHDPLCPWKVAGHLEIPIIALSELTSFESKAVAYLSGPGKKFLSAVTIFVGRYGRRRLIFHNDSHSKPRQAANIAHELSHAILCHPATSHSDRDEDAEEEASWMGPTLLVSNQAAWHIVGTGMSAETAQDLYNVSDRLLQMRLNMSGANKQRRRSNG